MKPPDLAKNSVRSAKVLDGTIAGGDIADGTVTGIDVGENALGALGSG